MNYFDQHGICQRCGKVVGNDITSIHTCTPTPFWRREMAQELRDMAEILVTYDERVAALLLIERAEELEGK